MKTERSVTMKNVMFAACLTAVGMLLGQENPMRLPPSEFADTEATTNCPFDFGQRSVRHFRFDMTLVGTASNCVQLAFGRDADADGVLDAGETGLTFAWDYGTWRLADPDGVFACFWTPQTTNAVKELKWDLHVIRRRARNLTLCENGVPLSVDGVVPDVSWLFDPDWNVLRLTVRGVDAPEEGVRVNLDISGYVIEVR